MYVCFNTVSSGSTEQMASTIMPTTPVPSHTLLTTVTSVMIGMTSMGKHHIS